MKANTFLNNSVVRDTASVALLPGSTRVLNRTTGQLVPCTSREVCPYSDDEPVMPAPGHGPGPQPEPLLVNRAPYLALATVSAAINNHASVGAQSRLLSLIAYLTSRNVSWELVTNPMAELGPYRWGWHVVPYVGRAGPRCGTGLDATVRRGLAARRH